MLTLTSSKGSITLPSPTYGDSLKLTPNRTNRRTRGNELVVVHADYWGKSLDIKYDIETLNQSQVHQLLQFLKDNLGLIITMVDYGGGSRPVMIITPDVEVRQLRDCDFAVSLEFREFFIHA